MGKRAYILLALLGFALVGKSGAKDVASRELNAEASAEIEQDEATFEPLLNDTQEERRAYSKLPDSKITIKPGAGPKVVKPAGPQGKTSQPGYSAKSGAKTVKPLGTAKQTTKNDNYPGFSRSPSGNTDSSTNSGSNKTPVECYSCNNCAKVSKSTPTKTCPPSKENRCVEYRQSYSTKETLYIRGCVSELGTCDDFKERYSNPFIDAVAMACMECTDNLCNSAHVTTSFSFAVSSLFCITMFKNIIF